MRKYIFICILILFSPNLLAEKILFSENFRYADKPINFSLYQLNKNLYKIKVIYNDKSSYKFYRFPIIDYKLCDVNSDGNPDICLCVAEKYDHFKRRLVIFTFDGERLAKLWIGSKLGNNLVGFDVLKIKNKTSLITFEKSKNDKIIVNSFLWSGFGFKWLQTLNIANSIDSAKLFLKGVPR